ncbi:MATE family efflux transporter [Treponema sp.]|uniref:MATE family efflux transporter n=1 Tax=Treponema sp. TaxID=166 RepID=UPI00298D7BCB|nr:MATE family efflux transporter [Treponema sp.]MCR5614294.1 MATE family efflux transporter [Treponema sp.]
MTKDLTEGRPSKLIFNFALPVLGGYLFQQFYNLADTAIVGKCLSVYDLAAVGSTGPVCFLIIGLCMGLTSGFAIPVAQSFGAKDYSKMRKFVFNAIILSIIFSILYAALTVILCKPLLRLMMTPADIIDHATDYVIIIFAGIPVGFTYNLASGILRSLGDSKTPLYFLLFSSALNIILDLICILVLHIGVQGAAIATVISQGISAVLCLIFIKKRFPILHFSKEEKQFSWELSKELLGMGIPMGLQYSITGIGSVILQSSVNTLGSHAVASMTAGLKIHMFFCAPLDAFGTTMATYSGQNVGARKIERLKSGLRDSSLMALVYCAFAFVVLFFFGDDLSLLFLDEKQTAIIKDAHQFLISNSSFYFTLALVNIVRFMIQGMGFSNLAVMSGIFEMIARSFFGFCLVPRFGFIAATFASPSAWVLADIFLISAFIYCYKKLAKRFSPADK